MDPASSRPASAGILAVACDIVVDEAAWRRFLPRAEQIARRAALAAGGAACVVLASDRAVRVLNRRHRGQDRPTNVLTFEAPRLPGPRKHAANAPAAVSPPSGPLACDTPGGGDIVLALGTVRREAAQAGRSTGAHLAHLVVHGALHLRGHDHHHPGDARRMELAEARILHRLGVANPWKAAARAAVRR
jgi:probable rRNA maturation factor